MASSEKLCLRWTEFADNISNAFYDLKEDKDFTDLTLVCAEHQQVEVHKVVVASSSNFFRKVLKNINHSRPLVYLKGIKIADMEALLSFMYQGQVLLAEENLNSFLALAEELEVKGLTCGKTSPVGNHQPPINANSGPKNCPSRPDLQNYPAQRLSSVSTVRSQTVPWVQGENVDQRAQNNNDGEVPQIKAERELVVHPQDGEALHVRNKSEASQFPGDPLDPALDLPHCEGPGDVDHGIKSFLDFNKYISKVDVGKLTCNICGKIGAHKFNMRKHVENNHFPGQLEYSCLYCEGKFDSMEKYLKHQTRKHSNTY